MILEAWKLPTSYGISRWRNRDKMCVTLVFPRKLLGQSFYTDWRITQSFHKDPANFITGVFF